ncbi:MAG: hypothetical protein WBA61_02660 [Aequorivita sp.]
MKKILALLLFLPFLQSCDDGDVIVTNFNFEDATLQSCGDVGNYVFYKVNPKVFESLSLKLGTTDSIYNKEEIKTYQLNGSTNFVNYRMYDGPLGSDYFCSSIPPTSPRATADYKGNSGSVVTTVKFVYENEKLAKKTLQITLKDLVLINGDEQIIIETLDMGTIEKIL